jgi:hypothetical protein
MSYGAAHRIKFNEAGLGKVSAFASSGGAACFVLDSRRHDSLTSQMSWMVASGEEQVEENRRLPVAQAMQKRREGRAPQQVAKQRVYWRWPGCHNLVVGVEKG